MKPKNDFLKNVWALAIPVALQSMLQSSFSMVDQIMIGQLGEINVAGVGLAGKFASIYSVVISAIGAVAGATLLSTLLRCREKPLLPLLWNIPGGVLQKKLDAPAGGRRRIAVKRTRAAKAARVKTSYWRSAGHRGTGELQKEGHHQAQKNTSKPCHHPEAAAADQLAGNKQPGQGQQACQRGHNGGDDPHQVPAPGRGEQKKHKNQRGAQKNPGHQPLQFAISISLSHAASLRRTFFYRYLITIRQKLQSF